LRTEHPTRAVLESYRLRTLAGEDLLETDDHISRCDSCRSAIGDSVQTSEVARRAMQALDEDHLSFEEMSSYADGLGDAEERSAVEMHMEVCAMCRREVSDLAEIAEVSSLSPLRGEGRGEGPRATSRERRNTSYAIAAILAAVFAGGSAYFWNVMRRQQVRPPGDTARRAPAPSPTPQPATPDSLEGLSPSLLQVVEELNAGTLASATLVASLQGTQGQHRGETASGASVRVLEPLGEVIETDRPTFRWAGVSAPDVAVVQVFDSGYNLVLESPEVQETSWTSPTKLKRGVTYRWQLVIRSSTAETTLPAPPDPPAQFRVLGAKALAELSEARRAGSDLEVGLICMREGLFDEGSRRIAAFAKAVPGSSAIRLAEKARGLAQPKSAQTAR